MSKKIKLSKGLFAIVDEDDYNKLSIHYWRAWNNGTSSRDVFYAVRQKGSGQNRKTFLMHRVIMNASSDEEIDHINGDGLDNRKENLRKVTRRENAQNQHIKRISRYIGVTYDKRINIKSHWLARIWINGKVRHLGAFKSEEDAAKAYDNKLLELGLNRVNFLDINE